jgi:hypothetical protein
MQRALAALLLTLAALAVLAPSAEAGIVSVQTANCGFGGSPRTCTLPGSAPASGNDWVIVLDPGGSTGTKTVSCSGCPTFTLDYTAASTADEEYFSGTNITNAPTAFTYTFSGGGSAFVAFWVIEFDDLGAFQAGSGVFESHLGATSGNYTVSPSTNDAYAMGFVRFTATQTCTPTGTNAAINPTGAIDIGLLYSSDLDASGSKDIGCTWGSTSSGEFSGVVYARASGGGGSTIGPKAAHHQLFRTR